MRRDVWRCGMCTWGCLFWVTKWTGVPVVSWTQSLNSNHDLTSLSDQSELANINGFFHLVWTTKNLVICSRSTLRRIEEKMGTVICRVFPGTNADLALHIWTT